MRLSPPGVLFVAALSAALSTVAACKLNSAGLGHGEMGQVIVGMPDGAAGGGGTGGASAVAGASGEAGAGGAGGVAIGGSGMAGDSGSAGDDSGGVDAASGASGSGGELDAAGADLATEAAPDAGGAVDVAPEAPPISAIGCADGTREGLTQLAKFPDVAACSGGWTIPGFLAPETRTPQCNRAAGNDSERTDGEGCSVADLCAEGWHVCESAHEFAMKATNCDLAFPGGAIKMFFATRQRGPVSTCDPANEDGTNNIYGCGNFGSNAPTICAPFMHMLRDVDCKANRPWMCENGPTTNTSDTELVDVTKPGSDHGGVLCCR